MCVCVADTVSDRLVFMLRVGGGWMVEGKKGGDGWRDGRRESVGERSEYQLVR